MGYRNIIKKLERGKLRFILVENILKHMFLLAAIFVITWSNIEGLEPGANQASYNIFLRELILTVVTFIFLGALKGIVEWSYLQKYLNGDRKGDVRWIKFSFVYIFGFLYIGLPLVVADNITRYSQMRSFNNFIISFIVYYLISMVVGVLAWLNAKGSLQDIKVYDRT